MPENKKQLILYTDGGSRGNPGPAAAAFILRDKNGNLVQGKAFYLGEATNNVAEYSAVLKALQAAKKLEADEINIFSDSELLVKQLNGQYKVKSEHILPLFQETLENLSRFKTWHIEHIPREKNSEADQLVNKALNLQRDCELKGQKKKAGKPLRLGVLISGGGRTLLNIHQLIRQGDLQAEIPLVISSRSTVAGVERAKNAGLEVKIIRTKDYPDLDAFSQRMEQELVKAGVDLVIQAGWLCLWKIPARYENKVMNIHPALLPGFGGKGMYGHHVHEAVLQAGCKVSGCTVHFCTNEYDRGPIIVQRTCPVCPGDDPDTLAARVFEQECIAYPEAIRLFAEGKLQVKNGIVKITP